MAAFPYMSLKNSTAQLEVIFALSFSFILFITVLLSVYGGILLNFW